VLAHAHGYVPVEEDFRDMEHFGVELPLQLRRRRPEGGLSQS
jgi:hypothetical protein